MKISYITFISDSDYDLIYRLLKSIENAHSDGKYNYEVFIFDNRINHKNIILNFNTKVKLIKSRGNCLWWCKEDSVLNYATGDWIRFVDSDDEVIGFPKDTNLENTKADIIFCNADAVNQTILEDSTDFEKNYTMISNYSCFYLYWRQLYRYDFIKDFYKSKKDMNIPDFFFNEDRLAALSILESHPKVVIDSNIIYKGIGKGRNEYSNDYLKRKFHNIDELIDFTRRLFTNEQTAFSEIARVKNIIMLDAEYIKKEGLDMQWYFNNVIKKVFNKEEIKQYFNIDC